MNEVLQRRLVGVLVLFAAAFALGSLLPDAKAPLQSSGMQVVTYDLGTGLPLDESLPTPAPTDAGAVEAPLPPDTRSAVQLRESVALGSSPSWYVQVGSFENQANARAVLVKLKQLRLPASIQPVQTEKALWYRVRVGPYPAEAPAQAAFQVIRRQGYNGAKLVRPESE